MLTKSTINSAFRVADQAFGKQRSIGVIPNSPLAVATKTVLDEFLILNDANLDGRTSTPDGICEMLVEASSSPDMSGRHMHDEAIAQLVSKIGPTVQKEFFLAKSAVVPATNKVIEAFQVQSASINKTPLSDYSIEVLKFTHFWYNTSFQQMVSRYADTPVVQVPVKLLGLEITDENALSFIRTGIPSFDEANAINLNAAEVATTLRRVFGTAANQLAEKLHDCMSLNYGNWMNESVYIFLAAKNLYENIPAGLNIDLADYRTYMSTVLAQSGKIVNAMFDKLDRDRRMKKLVLDFTNFVAVVEDALWQQFCNEGGTPEVLFGSMMSDKNFDYSHLLTNKDSYLAIYERYLTAQQPRQAVKRFDLLKNALIGPLTDAVVELSASEHRAVVERSVFDKINALDAKALDDTYRTVRNIICDTVYPGTQINRILDLYDEVHPLVKSGNPREIAAMTLIFYVTDWLTDQVVIESFTYPAEL